MIRESHVVLPSALVVALAIVAIASSSETQPPRSASPPVAMATIRGRVVASDTGRPLRRVTIRAATGGAQNLNAAAGSTTTDIDGRFTLQGLRPARYELTAEREGFLTVRYGQRYYLAPGAPIDLAAGQVLDDLTIVLPRGSAIVGRIVDEIGEPFPGVSVHPLQVKYARGRKKLMPVTNAPTQQTDDQGEYRIASLPPGEYVVVARTWHRWPIDNAPSSGFVGYAPTYYPGTDQLSQAERITIAPGQGTVRADFAMSVGRLARVSGTVFAADGTLVTTGSVGVSVVIRGPNFWSAWGHVGGPIKPDGTFSLSGLSPGDYELSATPTGTELGDGATLQILVTGDDLDGVLLKVAPIVTVKGDVVADDGQPRAGAGARAEIRLVNAVAFRDQENAPIDESGHFEIKRVRGPGVVSVASLSAGWSVKTVTIDGRDVTDVPVDFPALKPDDRVRIEVSRQSTKLAVAVTVDDKPAMTPEIVVFPEQTRFLTYESRRLKHVRGDTLGNATVAGLPPGDYRVIALDYVDGDDWQDPELLEKLKPLAARVTLHDGDTQSVSLTLKPR